MLHDLGRNITGNFLQLLALSQQQQGRLFSQGLAQQQQQLAVRQQTEVERAAGVGEASIQTSLGLDRDRIDIFQRQVATAEGGLRLEQDLRQDDVDARLPLGQTLAGLIGVDPSTLAEPQLAIQGAVQARGDIFRSNAAQGQIGIAQQSLDQSRPTEQEEILQSELRSMSGKLISQQLQRQLSSQAIASEFSERAFGAVPSPSVGNLESMLLMMIDPEKALGQFRGESTSMQRQLSGQPAAQALRSGIQKWIDALNFDAGFGFNDTPEEKRRVALRESLNEEISSISRGSLDETTFPSFLEEIIQDLNAFTPTELKLQEIGRELETADEDKRKLLLDQIKVLQQLRLIENQQFSQQGSTLSLPREARLLSNQF